MRALRIFVVAARSVLAVALGLGALSFLVHGRALAAVLALSAATRAGIPRRAA